MFKKILMVTFLFAVHSSLFMVSYAEEEKITITTYYPSPYGSYNELRSTRMAIGKDYIQGSYVCWQGDTGCTGSYPQVQIPTDPSDPDVDLIVQGNVGIGTTEPLGHLHIREPDAGGKGLVLDNHYGEGVRIREATSYFDLPTLGQGATIIEKTDDDTVVEGGIVFAAAPSSVGNSYPPNPNWAVNHQPLMVIRTDTGNVGIGTTGPKAQVEIQKSGTTDGSRIYLSGDTSILDFRALGSAVAGTKYGLSNANLQYIESNSGNFLLSAGGAYNLAFATNSLERVRITNAGNVGIGTTGPEARLEIQKKLAVNTEEPFIVLDSDNNGVGAGSSIQFRNILIAGPAGQGYMAAIAGVDDDNFDGRLEFRVNNDGGQTSSPLTSADTVMVIKQTGNVGIGTTSPTAGFKLDVIGALRCQSLTQYSSRDYKQDIETLAPSDYRDILKKLEQTEIFRFRYKEAKENSRLRLGLIAEEAPEEIVSHEGKGIDLGEAVSFLMAAVKAQAEEIKGLKWEISRLKRN